MEDLVFFPTKRRKIPLIWELPFLRYAPRSATIVVLVPLPSLEVLAIYVLLGEYWRYLQGVSASSYLRILLLPFAGPVI
jgi:hypothetical protein